MTNEDAIKASVNIIIEPILRLLQNDPHQWSTRPCSTCQSISAMIGKPFGCYEYQRIDEAKQ